MSISIRQQIVSACKDIVWASGQFKQVEDAEPYHYERAKLPACWIIEGDETIDHGALFGKAVCDLALIIQVLFKFNSNEPAQSLYRTGRAHLAQLQDTVMNHMQWGGLAMLTLEQGNAMGRLDTETQAFGVLTTQWVVRYRRDTFDPSKR